MWQYLPAVLSVLGMLIQSKGADQAGAAAKTNAQATATAAEFQAKQLDQQAGQSMATGQRQSAEQLRQAKLAQSRAIALAAASGAGASDPTVVRLMGEIGAEGAYRAGVAMYQGEEQARQLRLKAAAARYEGEAALVSGEARSDAYSTASTASLLSGAGTLYARYGMGGPNRAPVEDRTFE